jgi:hypothetical protein
MVPTSRRDQDGADLLVHAYLDGELDVASAIAIERRIEAEPILADQAADIYALRTVVRNKFPREQLPPHLKKDRHPGGYRKHRPSASDLDIDGSLASSGHCAFQHLNMVRDTNASIECFNE